MRIFMFNFIQMKFLLIEILKYYIIFKTKLSSKKDEEKYTLLYQIKDNIQ